MKKYEVKKADEEYDEKFLFYKEIEENLFDKVAFNKI